MLTGIRRSIRLKLTWVVLATTFAALLITAVLLVLYDVQTYQRSWVSDLTTQAEILGRASAPALAFDDPLTASNNLALLRVRSPISAAAIYTADGRLFASYVREDVSEPRLPAAPGHEGNRIENGELVVFKRIANVDEVLGTVYIRARYELLERLKSYLLIVGGVMVLSLLVAVLMSYFLQNVVTKPILEITEVAHQVKLRRDFELRARKTTEDETGYLVDTFNEMLAEVGRRTEELVEINRTLEHEMAVRLRAEEALRTADQKKDEFLATLSHELRNPLAPLRNALEILKVGKNLEATRTAHAIMERQLTQLVRLVDDLLDVSRISTGKLVLKKERVVLQTVVRSALDAALPFIESRGLQFSLSLPEGPVLLQADPTRLAQVFINLLHNAAKFTEPGGTLTFTAERRGAELVATVTDTGIGIPAEKLSSVFGMFTQLDRSLERPHAGLGVGLSLSRRLVELHGGTLEAFSEGPGRGSTFVVTLPGSIFSPGALGAPSAAAQANGESIRILIADDNQDFADSLAMILREMHHEVRVSFDGVEALSTASDWAPELAFLDIGLPRMNGYELAERLRGLPGIGDLVLVAVTGWGQEEDKRRAREAGFDQHLVKPVTPEQIRMILGAVRSWPR